MANNSLTPELQERLSAMISEIATQVEQGVAAQEIETQIAAGREYSLRELPASKSVLYIAVLDALQLKLNHREGFGDGDEHIYLRDIPQPQINLFETLIAHFPVLYLIQNQVNHCICDAFAGKKRVVLMDIGTGTGMQVLNILRMLDSQTTSVEHVTVIGIEPAKKALNTAFADITAASFEQFDVEFRPILHFIDIMDLTMLHDHLPESYDSLVVNLSFSLHHVSNRDDRVRVLRFLKGIEPSLLLLSEPDVDHFTGNYAERTVNCLNHFAGSFNLVDTLQISDDEKQGIKLFFAREIKDIVGNCECERVERHMNRDLWHELIHETNLETLHDMPLLEQEMHEGIRFVQADKASFQLNYNEYPIASLYLLA